MRFLHADDIGLGAENRRFWGRIEKMKVAVEEGKLKMRFLHADGIGLGAENRRFLPGEPKNEGCSGREGNSK